MSERDLTNMSLDELHALSKDIEEAIVIHELRRLAEARAILEEKAAELGVTLEAVVSVPSKRASMRVPPKYRHPENPSLTWSGRGPCPEWIAEHVARGGSREDFLIG